DIFSGILIQRNSYANNYGMQKIISGPEVKLLDEIYVSERNISSFDLMEKAAEAFCSWFTSRFEKDVSLAVFCGMGNNGGDGLAISRLLTSRGYRVKVFLIGNTANASRDFKKNLNIMPPGI